MTTAADRQRPAPPDHRLKTQKFGWGGGEFGEIRSAKAVGLSEIAKMIMSLTTLELSLIANWGGGKAIQKSVDNLIVLGHVSGNIE